MSRRKQLAFQRLIAPTLTHLFNTAYRLAGDVPDAEDLVQDTCVTAGEKLDELKSMEHPDRWLLRVLYNRFIDGARRQARAPVVHLNDGGAGYSAERLADQCHGDLGELTDRERAFLAACAKLSDTHRAVLSLRAGGGGRGTSEALPAGVTPGPEHAAALAADVMQELRVEVLSADALALAEQFVYFESGFTDRSAGLEERFDALSAASQILRRANDPNLTARFVASALTYAQQVEDAALNSPEFVAKLATLPPSEQAALREGAGQLRARVFRRLMDTGDPRLVRPMSEALLYDPHAEVRLAATRVLWEFTDDALARAALESAAASDPSAEVRELARSYVLDDADRLDDIFRVVRDTSLTDGERLEPIYYPGPFMSDIERGFVVDVATVDVIADLIARSDDEATRRQVLSTLGASESPSFAPILIERLRNDPVPEVRSVAATFLVNHRNVPDVVIALQTAAASDPAESVQSNATRVLGVESR